MGDSADNHIFAWNSSSLFCGPGGKKYGFSAKCACCAFVFDEFRHDWIGSFGYFMRYSLAAAAERQPMVDIYYNGRSVDSFSDLHDYIRFDSGNRRANPPYAWKVYGF